jgi:glycosyltransferase involved in cell wall biosynthesis
VKIVHTESSLGWGGQEIRILSEAEGMRARGHQVVIVAPGRARIYGEAQKRGLDVVALPMARKTLAGFRAVRRWIAENPCDVVNTHSSTDSWLVAAACRTLREKPPIVRTRHISAAIPNNMTTRWLYTRAARQIVTTGESLREQLVRDNGFPPERIVSIPTGIDSQRFAPGDRLAARRDLGLPEDAILIGIVATLRSWKGHRFLIDAVASLKRQDFRLVIVGDGPQRDALQMRIAERGVEDYIRMAGNQDDVRPWLRSFDIFALPSYANEGVPQALVQACLTGLPCVTTDIGAIPEVVKHDQTGLVVKPQDVESLAVAIERLADDPALRERLGRAARAHCERSFGYEAMLDRMERVFIEARGG